MNNSLLKLYMTVAALLGIFILLPSIMDESVKPSLVFFTFWFLLIVVLAVYRVIGRSSLKYLAQAHEMGNVFKAINWFFACLPKIVFGLWATLSGGSLVLSIPYGLFIEHLLEEDARVYVVKIAFGLPLFTLGLFAFRSLRNKWRTVFNRRLAA